MTKRKLDKLMKKLDNIKGRNTELVTVYIPAGYSLHDISNQLRAEKGTAENIKSKATRKNVISALDKIVQHLKVYKDTPDNGLALFCGNVSEKDGVSDIKLWAVEPPEELDTKLYWCDQKFDLGPLREFTKEKDVYGMIVLDSNEASLALLVGKKLKHLAHIESPVPGKFKAGGQSAQRFERVREGLLDDHLKKAAEEYKKNFRSDDVKGVIVGGPGPIKDRFVDRGYLSDPLKEKVLGVKDTGYTGEHGLEELLNRAQDILKEAAIAEEKELLEKFFVRLNTSGKAAYGLEDVVKAIKMGAVDTVLVSEEPPIEQVEYRCPCGESATDIVEHEDKNSYECPQCSKNMEILGERDIIESLEELAETTGAEVKVMSRDTAEGERLYQLGGIGALLRYKFQ